jgi:small subunit ribosomal protein S16
MESLTRRDGKAICNLGFYNPQTKLLKFNKKLLLQNVKNGAQLTNTLRHIILNNK